MKDSTGNVTNENVTGNITPPKSTTLRLSNSSVHNQIKPKLQFGFVSRDKGESELLDAVDIREVACSEETIMACGVRILFNFFFSCRHESLKCVP